MSSSAPWSPRSPSSPSALAPDLSSGVFTDTAPHNVAVSVRGLSKSYSIARNAAQHTTAGEALMHRLRHPFAKAERETFLALDDVSFDIQKGDVVGIIGRNGAGKSTLLKILSRITEPTKGRIDLYGRVGSLLEVGTGFHPELTGRENIFLNGAILGMQKSEIARQFDAIVDFSGTEQFLDTPVKRYSSGMYVRLAFAVAAHLNPEILIIDEVLAVGDAEFQKKCLGKMHDVAESGRTVIFVSHNMAALENLCNKAILLEHGSVTHQGVTKDVVGHYLEDVLTPAIEDASLAERTDRSGSGKVRLNSFHVEDTNGNRLGAVSSGMSVVFVFGYTRTENLDKVDVGLSISTASDQMLFVLYSSYMGDMFSSLPPCGEFRCRVERLPLSPGKYNVGARVEVSGEEADWPRDGVGFINVELGDFYGTGSKGFFGTSLAVPTPFMIDGEWSVQRGMSLPGSRTNGVTR